MNQQILQNKYIQLLPPVLALLILIIALWDFLTDQQFITPILAIYAILLIFTIILLYLQIQGQQHGNHAIKQFEKSLKGTLHHFKCPNCKSIFAIKKSKINNKKPFILQCPTCQTEGLIKPSPITIIEKIPQEKSPRSKYQCSRCGERLTLWSEGTMTRPKTQIFSCPYCGTNKPLNQLTA